MKKIYVWMSVLGIMAFADASMAATGKGYKLYPLPAVVVSSETQTDKGMVENQLISKEWTSLYKNNVEQFNNQFVAVVNKEFSELVVPKILKADRDRALVVSFHIVRARHYSVIKPNGTQDVYVPITGSLYFTNPRTTEVVLALSSTVKPIQTLSSSDKSFDDRVTALYKRAFDALLADLVSQAKGRFNPAEISTTISEVHFGLGLTSIGSRAGLNSGDKLISDDGVPASLLSCDEETCVAKRSVGEIEAGAAYVKLSTGKLNALEKPSVFVLVKTPKTPALDAVWAQIFAENLGDKAPFNVVFFNPAFDYVLTTVSRDNEISREDVERRDPPELVVEISVDEPLGYKVPTNLSYKFSAGFVGRATAKVIDRSANVIFASSSIDVISDEVTEGIDFSAEDRGEISIKNALIALAEKVSQDFKPSELSFSLKQNGNRYSTDDPGRLLITRNTYPVYRDIKRSGSGKTARLPIGFVKVSRSAGAEKEFSRTPQVVGPKKTDIASGDKIVVRNVVSKALSGESALSLCGLAENRGRIELSNIHEKIFAGISSSLSYPFFDGDALAAIDFMFRGQSGFVETEVKSTDGRGSGDFCIQPIQKIEPGEKECKKDICQIPISVKLGASLIQGGSSLSVKAVEQRVMTPGFAASASAEQQINIAMATAEQAVDPAVLALRELVKPAFEAVIQQQSVK